MIFIAKSLYISNICSTFVADFDNVFQRSGLSVKRSFSETVLQRSGLFIENFFNFI